MKEGSLVKMVKPLGEDAKIHLRERGLPWPNPSEIIHTITDMSRGNSPLKRHLTYISLDTHPELHGKYSLLADLFLEVMPPEEIDVKALVEECMRIPVEK